MRTVKDSTKNQEPIGGGNPPQKPLAESASKDKTYEDVEVPQKEGSDDDSVAKTTSDKTSDEGSSDRATSEKGSDKTKSVAGRKKMKGGEPKDPQSGKEKPKDGKKEVVKEPQKSKQEREVEAEMNSILKRGPSMSNTFRSSERILSKPRANLLLVIIFSKSYCPYSAKAKRILMDKYTIVPKPYVVELNLHPLGVDLQNALEKSTGRRTVPNILINGKSVGGGDDIESAEIAGTLIEKIKNLGGKRIMEVTQRRTGD